MQKACCLFWLGAAASAVLTPAHRFPTLPGPASSFSSPEHTALQVAVEPGETFMSHPGKFVL